MKFRISIIFLALVFLLLTSLCVGTSGAEPVLEDFINKAKNNEQILGYNETIYVSGDTVTIVTNFESTYASTVRKFNNIVYNTSQSPDSANNKIFKNFTYNVKENIIQFNVSELGLMKNGELKEEFTVYLCGNISGDYSNKHVDNEIKFRVEKVSEDKTIVYPIQNNYTHNFTISVYYFIEYDSFFSDDSLYPDFKEEIIGKNVIYSYDKGNLRSVYWYDADAEGVAFKSSGSLKPYEPEFILNLSNLQDFNLNSIFICSEHDAYTVYDHNNRSKNLTDTGVSCSSCSSDIDWVITIGESEKEDSSKYLMTYNDLYPIEEDNDDEVMAYSHFISFNSSALNNDLLKDRTLSVQFYPIADFKNKVYDFTFKRLSQFVSITVDQDGALDLVTEQTDTKKPVLSSMIFPSVILDKLSENSLVLATLNTDVFNDIEDSSDLITAETDILSIMDIGFESNGNEINDLLAENGERVTLTFSIPTVIDGSNVDLKKLEVVHIVEINGKKTVEKLLIDSGDSGTINGVNCYNITTSTSGFSPFAVISIDDNDNPEPPVSSSSGGQSFGEAVVVPPKENVKDDKNGYVHDISSPVDVIEDIITTVQGHLSVFSILVVLTSGLFMWTYIRRRI